MVDAALVCGQSATANRLTFDHALDDVSHTNAWCGSNEFHRPAEVGCRLSTDASLCIVVPGGAAGSFMFARIAENSESGGWDVGSA